MSRSSRSRSRDERRTKQSQEDEQKNDGRTLYVANLGFHAVEEDVQERFSVFGTIEKLEMMKDPYTKEPRGFAFITYEDALDASDAQRKMDKAQMNGRNIRVEFSRRKQGHSKTPGRYADPVSASRKYSEPGGPAGPGYNRDYGRDSRQDFDRPRRYDSPPPPRGYGDRYDGFRGRDYPRDNFRDYDRSRGPGLYDDYDRRGYGYGYDYDRRPGPARGRY